jgi:hypothetical protein
VEQWVRQALELPGLHLAAPRRQDGVPGQDGFFYFLAKPPRRKEGQRGKKQLKWPHGSSLATHSAIAQLAPERWVQDMMDKPA